MTMEGAVNYASMEEEMMIITVVATEDIDCYKMDTNAKNVTQTCTEVLVK
jgi:hypothetical protein